MDILRRRARAKEAVSKESPAEGTVNRRIEITVERETVTMLVRGRPGKDAEMPQGDGVEWEGGSDAPESRRRELLLAASASENQETICPEETDGERQMQPDQLSESNSRDCA